MYIEVRPLERRSARLDNLIKKLVYAGLDKAEFDALKSEAVKESRKSLKSYSLFAGVMFALLAAVRRGAVCGAGRVRRLFRQRVSQ